MYGIIGEDDSDVETIKVLLRRLAKNAKLTVMAKGYSGCAEMLRKGAKQLKAYSDTGCSKLIVCYDSDGHQSSTRKKEVEDKIVNPSGTSKPCLVLIPVEELEAWILADIKAVSKVFPSWRPKEIKLPESIPSPKEYLEKLSRAANKKPRYSHATHNRVVATHLDLTIVSKKCESFRILEDFVTSKTK